MKFITTFLILVSLIWETSFSQTKCDSTITNINFIIENFNRCKKNSIPKPILIYLKENFNKLNNPNKIYSIHTVDKYNNIWRITIDRKCVLSKDEHKQLMRIEYFKQGKCGDYFSFYYKYDDVNQKIIEICEPIYNNELCKFIYSKVYP